jgi:hypothetical protein
MNELPTAFERSARRDSLHCRVRPQQRLEWLLANPALWEDIEMNRGEIAYERPRCCNSVRILFEQMQSAGLYSWATVWSDVDIEQLVERAGQAR